MFDKNLYSINLHFWPYCNMKCQYCFANFSHIEKPLSKEDWFEIIRQLTDNGMRKVNFVGGEPTLCPDVVPRVRLAVERGPIAKLHTNASLFDETNIETPARPWERLMSASSHFFELCADG